MHNLYLQFCQSGYASQDLQGKELVKYAPLASLGNHHQLLVPYFILCKRSIFIVKEDKFSPSFLTLQSSFAWICNFLLSFNVSFTNCNPKNTQWSDTTTRSSFIQFWFADFLEHNEFGIFSTEMILHTLLILFTKCSFGVRIEIISDKIYDKENGIL